jgi:tRNA(Ile)-lysidine synthase TilS/MesJ
MAIIARCTRCVLPGTFPGIRFDAAGVCQFCLEDPAAEAEARRLELRSRLDLAIDNARKATTDYQGIVAFSGGKDSTYTLMMLARDHGLRCLAVTVDNGFLSDSAVENCKKVTDALGVDHIFYKPAFGFMRKMYTESLNGGVHAPASIKRASDVCSSCINLINTQMIKLAVQHNVSLIAGGYLGGQVPKDSAVLELEIGTLRTGRAATLQRYKTRFGEEAQRHFSLPDGSSGHLTIINPMLAEVYSEEEIVEKIKDLGWVRPNDTGGHSSNCRLNDLGIMVHHKRYGFHPYAFELAELVRKGFMDRDTAIAKLEKLPVSGDLTAVLSKLEFNERNL